VTENDGREINIEKLTEEHGKMVYNIAFRILGNHHDAEDTMQETFIKVCENSGSFTARSSPATWIYRIAVNQAIRHKHQLNSVVQNSFDDSIHRDDVPVPEYLEQQLSPAEARFFKEQLMQDIRDKCHYFVTFRLTEEQRVVFLLRDMFGFSYADISFILDIPESSVKSRLKRARDNLINHFKSNCFWYNSGNPCRCDKKIGYVLSKYPQALKDIQRRANSPEHLQLVEDLIVKRRGGSGKSEKTEGSFNTKLTLEEIYARIPMLEPLMQSRQ